jgi:hypothetical protein
MCIWYHTLAAMFRTVFKNDTLTFFDFGVREGCCCFSGLPKSFPPLSVRYKIDLGRYQFVIKKLGKFTTWGNLFANVVLTGRATGRPKK